MPSLKHVVAVTDVALFVIDVADANKPRLHTLLPLAQIVQLTRPAEGNTLRLVLSQGRPVDVACADEDTVQVRAAAPVGLVARRGG